MSVMQNDQSSTGEQPTVAEQTEAPASAPGTGQQARPAAHASAALIVWQLLTYALWGWALATLSILLGAALHYFVADQPVDYEFSLYALAALIILVPLAFVADRFYAKNEPEEKHGFSAVIMVLSAVIVFLATLGGIITAVVTALSILVNPGDTTAKVIVILTSLIVSLLGGLLFVRILNPPKLRRFTRRFPLIIVGIVAVSLVFAAAGPFVSEIRARDDKLVEQHLPSLNNAVQDYAQDNDALPERLSDLSGQRDYDKDAQRLVSENLVEYRVVDSGDDSGGVFLNNNDVSDLTLFSDGSNRAEARYELCATYNHAKGNRDYETYGQEFSGDYDSSHISTYSHPAGRVCYKLRAYLK